MENKEYPKKQPEFIVDKKSLEHIAVHQILTLGRCVRQIQIIKNSDDVIELNLNILGMWVKYKGFLSKKRQDVGVYCIDFIQSISYVHIPKKIITIGFENYRKHLLDLNLISLN